MNHKLGSVIIIAVLLEAGLIALWIAVGSARPKRPHFLARIFLASLALPAWVTGLIAQWIVLPDDLGRMLFPLLLILGVVVLMLVPGLLYRMSDSPSGPSESDGGAGPGPDPPSPPPHRPRGGVPLPDAEQASSRARDHSAPKFADPRQRRPAHEPSRPARLPV